MNNPLQIRNSFLYRWDFSMYCHNLMQKKKTSVFPRSLHWGETNDAALNLYLLSVLFQIPFSCVHCTCDPIYYNRGYFYILSSVSIYRIITEFEVYLRSFGANNWSLLHGYEGVMEYEILIIIQEELSESWLKLITSNTQMLSYPRYGGKAPEITSVSVIFIVTVCGYC